MLSFLANTFRSIAAWFVGWFNEPITPEPVGTLEERILRKIQPYKQPYN